ncbi:MAG: YraN family protein [Planctomycetota bacterium]
MSRDSDASKGVRQTQQLQEAPGCLLGWAAKARSLYLDWKYGPIDSTASIGHRGEQAAARMLRRKGLNVIAHSESDRAGEIDLIAIDRQQKRIIFVEVKTLATRKPGHPAERVDQAKQDRVTRAALRYMKRNRILGIKARFDVVAVWWHDDAPEPQRIEHYEAAFEASDFGIY